MALKVLPPEGDENCAVGMEGESLLAARTRPEVSETPTIGTRVAALFTTDYRESARLGSIISAAEFSAFSPRRERRDEYVKSWERPDDLLHFDSVFLLFIEQCDLILLKL